jgi:glycosyltransferase involved in cell wall biosynthesis
MPHMAENEPIARASRRDAALNVALVTETWLPEINGVARTLGRLVEGLHRHGHRVDLVRPRQGAGDTPRDEALFAETLVAGMPIPRYPELRFGLPVPTRLLRQWSQHRPDIVHIATEGPLGISALRAARRLGLPTSTSFHTNFDAYSRHYGFGWLHGAIAAHLRRFHNQAEVTLVPTQCQAQELRLTGYERIEVLARGVDTAQFNPQRRSAELRRHWQVDAQAPVVAYVGRLAPEKNLAVVLDAFAAIRQRRADARLLFVGDGPARRDLQRRHPEHIYAGWRTGSELAEHYASADLFLFPSLTETFGNVTLEALASGLAVVAYDHAAAADLVRDDVNGRLVSAGDATAFAAAAAEIAADADTLYRLRDRAALSVSQLGWERIQDRFVGVLHETVSRHARAQALKNALIMAPD